MALNERKQIKKESPFCNPFISGYTNHYINETYQKLMWNQGTVEKSGLR
jgi:hypothetical protein